MRLFVGLLLSLTLTSPAAAEPIEPKAQLLNLAADCIVNGDNNPVWIDVYILSDQSYMARIRHQWFDPTTLTSSQNEFERRGLAVQAVGPEQIDFVGQDLRISVLPGTTHLSFTPAEYPFSDCEFDRDGGIARKLIDSVTNQTMLSIKHVNHDGRWGTAGTRERTRDYMTHNAAVARHLVNGQRMGLIASYNRKEEEKIVSGIIIRRRFAGYKFTSEIKLNRFNGSDWFATETFKLVGNLEINRFCSDPCLAASVVTVD